MGGVENMRVLLFALGICVSSAAVSAAFFLTVFDNNERYEFVSPEKASTPVTVVAEEDTVAEQPTINLAALTEKGLSPEEMSWRARGSYRVPIPRQNPFDQVVDISELIAVSGDDLEDQSAAIGLSPSVELAKEQLDGLGDDNVLSSSAALAPEALGETTVDPASLGILGVILDAAMNGGQTVNTSRDVGPATPFVTIEQ